MRQVFFWGGGRPKGLKIRIGLGNSLALLMADRQVRPNEGLNLGMAGPFWLKAQPAFGFLKLLVLTWW